MSDRIDIDNRLYPGDSYTSKNGKYKLILQTDSNFVLYKKHDNDDGQDALWSTNTAAGDDSATNKSVILQADGVFIMYGPDGKELWSTGTRSYEGLQKPYIMVQDDGNVVLYDEGKGTDAMWSTGTYQN